MNYINYNISNHNKKRIILFIITILSLFLLVGFFLFSLYSKENRKKIEEAEDGANQYHQYKKSLEYEELNPILRDLPIVYSKYDYNKNISFRIDGGSFSSCKTSFCLKITDYSGDSYAAAIEKLKEYGYDPSKYEIITVSPESHQKSE